jgi:hypothetical protein
MDVPRSFMEFSNLVGLWGALMSTLQGIGAVYGLVDRSQKRKLEKEGTPVLSKFNPLLISILLFIGTAATIAFATWMFVAKPLRPKIQTVEQKIYVDKPIPCPPSEQKNGTATARGKQAIAHSGNGDNYKTAP